MDVVSGNKNGTTLWPQTALVGGKLSKYLHIQKLKQNMILILNVKGDTNRQTVSGGCNICEVQLGSDPGKGC